MTASDGRGAAALRVAAGVRTGAGDLRAASAAREYGETYAPSAEALSGLRFLRGGSEVGSRAPQREVNLVPTCQRGVLAASRDGSGRAFAEIGRGSRASKRSWALRGLLQDERVAVVAGDFNACRLGDSRNWKNFERYYCSMTGRAQFAESPLDRDEPSKREHE